MLVQLDGDSGIITLIPAAVEEAEAWGAVTGNLNVRDLLSYGGRGGAKIRDPYDQRMTLTFNHGGVELKLTASDDESEQHVREIRDTIFFGGGGLIYLESRTTPESTHHFLFTIGFCKVCGKPVATMGNCEWSHCNACREACEHIYESGPIHGGGIDIGVGEFCSTCGLGKPKAEGESERSVLDRHLEVEEELGIFIMYENLNGIGPHELKAILAKPKVLVVEDNREWARHWVRELGSLALVGVVETLEAAEALLPHISDFALIVMDACVPGDSPNSMPLVRAIRASGFQGPIIATSSFERFRRDLMEAGCDHEADKAEVPGKVIELLPV